jgi:hypothetical protein
MFAAMASFALVGSAGSDVVSGGDVGDGGGGGGGGGSCGMLGRRGEWWCPSEGQNFDYKQLMLVFLLHFQ